MSSLSKNVDNSLYIFSAELEEVLFYDAVENPEELLEDENEGGTKAEIDPRIKKLNQRLIFICRKKASVRNKKVTIRFQFCSPTSLVLKFNAIIGCFRQEALCPLFYILCYNIQLKVYMLQTILYNLYRIFVIFQLLQ